MGRSGAWCAGLGLALWCIGSYGAGTPSACDYLSARVAAMPAGPVLLASYPSEHTGALGDTAFTYDNAVSAIALIACHQPVQARRLADALVLALDHDRFWHDGRLRNAYAAGAIAATGPVKLPGWWDPSAGRWMEDRYQVGSDTGNMAWAMLSLWTVAAASGERRYLDSAVRVARWTEGRVDVRGAGGFTGGEFGHEPVPQSNKWKSTEHNTDLAAAFAWLARATGDAHWQQRAQSAQTFVLSMWDVHAAYFAVGSTEDGVTRNPLLALDAQVWPQLALPGIASHHAAALATSERLLRAGAGYTYSEAGGGQWTEGSAQVALLLALLQQDDKARGVTAALGRLQAPDGAYYASDAPAAPTGFMLETDPGKPRVYYHLEHLGASAWVALSEQRYNPFVGRSALP
jgi:hypothetical protein